MGVKLVIIIRWCKGIMVLWYNGAMANKDPLPGGVRGGFLKKKATFSDGF
jgi:hypothetical protein